MAGQDESRGVLVQPSTLGRAWSIRSQRKHHLARRRQRADHHACLGDRAQRALTTSRTFSPQCARACSPASIRLTSAALSRISRRSSIAWNTSPPSAASSTTTTPRQPMSTPPSRRWNRSPAGIHLILGGKDKGSDYSVLNPLLAKRVKRVYTIGAAAPKIESQIKGTQVVSVGTIDNAVRRAANRRRRETSCCSLRPVPASTSSSATNIAAASSKTWSSKSSRGNCSTQAAAAPEATTNGQARQRRQVAVHRGAAAGLHRTDHGVQRLGGHGAKSASARPTASCCGNSPGPPPDSPPCSWSCTSTTSSIGARPSCSRFWALPRCS